MARRRRGARPAGRIPKAGGARTGTGGRGPRRPGRRSRPRPSWLFAGGASGGLARRPGLRSASSALPGPLRGAAQVLHYERGCSVPADQAPTASNTCSASSGAVCLFVTFLLFFSYKSRTLLLSVKIEQEAC